jgi:arylsulfatase A-like enzyme
MKRLELHGPLIAATLACCYLAGCANDETPDALTPPVLEAVVDKVLLISIDSLRPDFLTCYNSDLDTTPHLARFASESTLFTDVLSHAASTAISHKSLFYSLYPSVHKTSRKTVPDEDVVSPFEALQQNGFLTAGFIGGGQLNTKFGFGKGFDEYVVLPPLKEGSQVETLQSESLRWLGEHHDEKFFLFLHTYEPHCPYVPPDEYANKYAGWYQGDIDPADKCGSTYYNELEMTSDDYQFVRDLYAAEVAYVDSFLGRLFEELKRLELYDETLIVFTSDHGESLGERNYIGHNRLYNQQLRVPLIVKLPGTEPSRVDAPLESIDVMPTILAAVGVAPPYPFQGQNLIPLMEGNVPPGGERFRVARQGKTISVHRGPWHLLFSQSEDEAELYDLRSDPEELENLASENPEVMEDLKKDYARLMQDSKDLSAKFVLRDGGRPRLDKKTREQLKALGYVQ